METSNSQSIIKKMMVSMKLYHANVLIASAQLKKGKSNALKPDNVILVISFTLHSQHTSHFLTLQILSNSTIRTA